MVRNSFTKRMVSALCVAVLLGTGLLTGCSKSEKEQENQTSEQQDDKNNGGSEDMKQNYTVDNLDEYVVPEWYRDAKFGIFIHYGVYSVPAFGDEWYGHWMYMQGTRSYGGSDIYTHHLNTYGGSAEFGYKEFIPDFLTELSRYKENNMAEEWAELFAQAGAKYVMPVGIHHDSYALYDSDIQSTYNSVNQAGVDYVGDLQAAVTSRGMKFGISNHFAENDWFFDDNSAAGTDIAEKNEDGSLVYGELYGDGKTKSSEHIHKWYDISMEIINKYHPDIIYYDFDLVMNQFNTYSDANRYLMLANYYNQAMENNPEGVVCCNKNGAFTQAQALLEKERSSLSTINPTPWQTDTSIGLKSWCYTTDDVYRSGDEFIGALVDIVSKNGNLLLNVGPEADGTIPEEAKEALLTIGSWLGTYGDAIYATRPWLIAGEGSTTNSGDSFVYRSDDIRFTRSKDNSILYATALAKPTSDKMTIKSLNEKDWDASTINKISLIKGEDREELTWKQTEEGLVIDIPQSELSGPYSVEITFTDNVIPAYATGATELTQPSNYYDAKEIKIGNSTEDGSYTVISKEDGAYLKQRLDFTDANVGTLWLDVSGESEGKIRFYNDETDELISEAEITADANDAYHAVTADVTMAEDAGKINVRMEFTGKIELSGYRFIEKRSLNKEIDASRFDSKTGTVQAETTADPQGGGESLGYVSAGDTVLYSGVDFGTTCKQVKIRAGAAGKMYRIYIDRIDAEHLIAEGTIATGGYNNYTTLSSEISGVSGVHDVYFVFVGDAINLNWILFTDEEYVEGSGETATKPHGDELRKLNEKIEAESFDEKQGTVQAEPIVDGTGQNLGWVSVGDWVAFTQVEMTGAKTVTARLAGMGGNIEVHLDAADGEIIATFENINTGAWGTYKEISVELKKSVEGVHTIYLVYTGAASNIDWFVLK